MDAIYGTNGIVFVRKGNSVTKRLSYTGLLQKLHSAGNGLHDIYKIDISAGNLAK